MCWYVFACNYSIVRPNIVGESYVVMLQVQENIKLIFKRNN